jgi:hypothetical protein
MARVTGIAAAASTRVVLLDLPPAEEDEPAGPQAEAQKPTAAAAMVPLRMARRGR